jgi:hypothetical protein
MSWLRLTTQTGKPAMAVDEEILLACVHRDNGKVCRLLARLRKVDGRVGPRTKVGFFSTRGFALQSTWDGADIAEPLIPYAFMRPDAPPEPD